MLHQKVNNYTSWHRLNHFDTITYSSGVSSANVFGPHLILESFPVLLSGHDITNETGTSLYGFKSGETTLSLNDADIDLHSLVWLWTGQCLALV